MPKGRKPAGFFDMAARKRECVKCHVVKPFEGFHAARTAIGVKSVCKECHAAKYAKWETPSLKAKRREARERREAFLDTLLTCPKCGGSKPRRDWPKQPRRGGHYNKTCCLHDTNAVTEPIRADGTRRCRDCAEVKPVSQFPANKRNSTGIQAYCYDCSKERTKVWKHAKPSALRAQRERRYRRILEQSDGTL